MISFALFVMLLMQSPGYNDGMKSLGEAQIRKWGGPSAETTTASALCNGKTESLAVVQQQRFAASFNRMVEAMQSFAIKYNADRAIDVRKVKALKKAWRELESSEEWFKPQKKTE